MGRKFGSRWVFRGLDFEVTTGQVLAVLGPNGCGKSTLLKTIAGLALATEGTVETSLDPYSEIGYCSLENSVFPVLTASEHLDWAARSRGVPSRPEELLALVGLDDAGSKVAGEFSSGMKMRLKLALSLQPNPKLLILDEPTASLDELGREAIERIVKRQAEQGAVLFATNDQAERRWATHELILG